MAKERVYQQDVDRFVSFMKDKFRYDLTKYSLINLKYSIERVLDRRAKNLTELMNSVKSMDDLNTLIIDLSVKDTELFRDPGFYRFLMTDVLGGKGDAKRIWLQGRNTGQELYSLLILLDKIDRIDEVEIVCTELVDLVDSEFGFYSDKQMELNQSNYQKVFNEDGLSEYYTKTPKGVKMNEDLIKNVKFSVLDPTRYGLDSKADLVMVRNRLTAYNKSAQFKVEHNSERSLNVGGFIAIGVGEQIVNRSVLSKFNEVNGEYRVYKKKRD